MATITYSPVGTASASATAADPIDVTCASHPFATGDAVLIVGYDEMTAANGAASSTPAGWPIGTSVTTCITRQEPFFSPQRAPAWAAPIRLDCGWRSCRLPWASCS